MIYDFVYSVEVFYSARRLILGILLIAAASAVLVLSDRSIQRPTGGALDAAAQAARSLSVESILPDEEEDIADELLLFWIYCDPGRGPNIGDFEHPLKDYGHGFFELDDNFFFIWFHLIGLLQHIGCIEGETIIIVNSRIALITFGL